MNYTQLKDEEQERRRTIIFFVVFLKRKKFCAHALGNSVVEDCLRKKRKEKWKKFSLDISFMHIQIRRMIPGYPIVIVPDKKPVRSCVSRVGSFSCRQLIEFLSSPVA